RRLVAVMFTDMVGYTALMRADEGAALEKRERYWGALEGHHDGFGGTVVQRLGDGSMSMFPSSLAAVQAAVGIQRELSAQDVPVRLGIHVGEVNRRRRAAHGRSREHRGADRVVRDSRRSDAVRFRLRPDQEPE